MLILQATSNDYRLELVRPRDLYIIARYVWLEFRPGMYCAMRSLSMKLSRRFNETEVPTGYIEPGNEPGLAPGLWRSTSRALESVIPSTHTLVMICTYDDLVLSTQKS